MWTMPRGAEYHRKRMRLMDMPESHKIRLLKGCSKSERAMRNVAMKIPSSILEEILSRLPTKSLLKFSCVCRSWQELIREPYFARLQLKNGPDKSDPNILILRFEHGLRRDFLYHYEEDRAWPLFEKFQMRSLPRDQVYSLTNSCNGLICLLGSKNSAYLVNPSTGEFVPLPNASVDCHANRLAGGLAFDDLTGEYKVVRLFFQKHMRMACEVLTLGNSYSRTWRRIRWERFCDDSLYVLGASSVLVNGAMHWTVVFPGPEVAVSFNARDESLEEILHPKGDTSDMRTSEVGQLEGCLCLIDLDEDTPQFDVWILKDYSRRKWVKQYSLRMLPQMAGWADCIVRPLHIRNGIMLLTNGTSSMAYFDPEIKSFRRLLDSSPGEPILLSESLVSPRVIYPVSDFACEHETFGCRCIDMAGRIHPDPGKGFHGATS